MLTGRTSGGSSVFAAVNGLTPSSGYSASLYTLLSYHLHLPITTYQTNEDEPTLQNSFANNKTKDAVAEKLVGWFGGTRCTEGCEGVQKEGGKRPNPEFTYHKPISIASSLAIYFQVHETYEILATPIRCLDNGVHWPALPHLDESPPLSTGWIWDQRT
ncbi:hypothetical protein BDD12DRAFT_808970 [Trichophaea hybrida]|nr:hypothetical protein BDD12DRAFT_808970 [Trichophaea hybrida]